MGWGGWARGRFGEGDEGDRRDAGVGKRAVTLSGIDGGWRRWVAAPVLAPT